MVGENRIGKKLLKEYGKRKDLEICDNYTLNLVGMILPEWEDKELLFGVFNENSTMWEKLQS